MDESTIRKKQMAISSQTKHTDTVARYNCQEELTKYQEVMKRVEEKWREIEEHLQMLESDREEYKSMRLTVMAQLANELYFILDEAYVCTTNTMSIANAKKCDVSIRRAWGLRHFTVLQAFVYATYTMEENKGACSVKILDVLSFGREILTEEKYKELQNQGRSFIDNTLYGYGKNYPRIKNVGKEWIISLHDKFVI